MILGLSAANRLRLAIKLGANYRLAPPFFSTYAGKLARFVQLRHQIQNKNMNMVPATVHWPAPQI